MKQNNYSLFDNSLNISSEISNLVWIADGDYKNYNPQEQYADEPSALYFSLPVSRPENEHLVPSPSYYPDYRDLSPEQRWLYWKFLSDPFSGSHNIGYVFLFYYGLERFMLTQEFDKAFYISLKLREIYSHNSFQVYSSKALVLMCSVKSRKDLALDILHSYMQSPQSYLPVNYLLTLKYSFQIPLYPTEIIQNHMYFGFTNDRYIKKYPELFLQTLEEFIQRDFSSNTINLNQYYPVDLKTLPQSQTRIFSNSSLWQYEINFPDFDNHSLNEKILSLLDETHDTVKQYSLKQRKKVNTSVTPQNPRKAKLSPIEVENIPLKLSFDFSALKDWQILSDKHILDMFEEPV